MTWHARFPNASFANAGQGQLAGVAKKVHDAIPRVYADEAILTWAAMPRMSGTPKVTLSVQWLDGGWEEHEIHLRPYSEGSVPVSIRAPTREPGPAGSLVVRWVPPEVGVPLDLWGEGSRGWPKSIVAGAPMKLLPGWYRIEGRGREHRLILGTNRVEIRDGTTVPVEMKVPAGCVACRVEARLPSGLAPSEFTIRLSKNGSEVSTRRVKSPKGEVLLLPAGACDIEVLAVGCDNARRSIVLDPGTGLQSLSVQLHWRR